jgi:phosphatidylserine decarboxylase
MKTSEYWDREKQQILEDRLYRGGVLRFLHNHWLGRFLMRSLLSRVWASRLIAWPKCLRGSRKDIPPFVEQFELDESEFVKPVEAFTSFDDFITRALKPGARPSPEDPDALVSPADGQVTVQETLSAATVFEVKGKTFTLERLLDDPKLAASFAGGSLAVVYLAPYDYHRFHYPLSGTLESTWRIGNRLFCVNALSLECGFRPFDLNVRDIAIIRNPITSRMLMVEIGAFFVGKIMQTNGEPGEKERGEEKGYFGLGASTIVLVFPNGTVRFDEDLLEMSRKGIPSKVKQGEPIGRLVGRSK